MPITTYNASDLIGENGERILSELDPTTLIDGDRCIAMIDGVVIFFKYFSDSDAETDIENHPYKVRPNAFSGTGVWIEQLVSTSTIVLFGKTSPPSALGLKEGTIYIMYE